MTRYFIGIGSNENANENCRKMISALQEQFGAVRVSQIIQTRAYGVEAPDYLNAVACIESSLSRDDLNLWCKSQELKLGRDRQKNVCSADLDILIAVNNNERVDPTQTQDEYYRPLITELICCS